MYRKFIFCLIVLFYYPVYAFDLFDKNRGQPPVTVQPPPITPPEVKIPTPPPAPKPIVPPPPQRDFVLQGTARLGNKWLAVLQAPDGKPIIQEWENNARTPLKDHPEYAVVKIEARKVTLAYPNNSPCQKSNVQKGIQCQQNGQVASLSLRWRDAIKPPPTPKPVQPVVKPPATGQKLTPSEIQRREAERKKRQELYKNFKRKVIKDEDVPPGMRVIRTPFGDRLVPDNRNK